MTEERTCVSENNTAFLVHLGLVVVVDAEFGEENLVLVGSIGPLPEHERHGLVHGSEEIHLERFLGLGAIHPAQLDKRPESRVVEVVDVT